MNWISYWLLFNLLVLVALCWKFLIASVKRPAKKPPTVVRFVCYVCCGPIFFVEECQPDGLTKTSSWCPKCGWVEQAETATESSSG